MSFLFYLFLIGFWLFLIFRLFTRDDSKAMMGVVFVFCSAIYFLILGWAYIMAIPIHAT